jgi:hypothetical protein
MKNKLAISIIIVLSIVFIVAGSTFAYFSAVIKGTDNKIKGNSANFNVIYYGDNSFIGNIRIVTSKEEEGTHSSTVQIGLDTAINGVTGDILFNVTNISNNLKINGFKWEVYTVSNNVETLYSSGNFSNATNNSVIPLVQGYPLSTTLTTFKVYIWLDGNDSSTGNGVLDGTAHFAGYISAKSNNLTGTLS